MYLKFQGAEPTRHTSGAAGYDLCAAGPGIIQPGDMLAVSTGTYIDLHPTFDDNENGAAPLAGLVLPRSGLAVKHGVTVLNGPGLIDPDYRGEIKVLLINHGKRAFVFSAHDRIAQLLLVPFNTPWFMRGELSETERGVGGFGSTGVENAKT